MTRPETVIFDAKLLQVFPVHQEDPLGLVGQMLCIAKDPVAAAYGMPTSGV